LKKSFRDPGLALAVVGGVLSIGAHDSQSQTVRAVHFSGTSCLYNASIQSPFASSPSVEVSAWLGFNTISAGQVQSIVVSHTNGANPTTALDFHIENDVGLPNISNGTHLYLLTTDGIQNSQYSQWVSDEVLPSTGWHHLWIASDTSQVFTNGNYTVVAFLDGIELTPNAAHTYGNTVNQQFFTTPYFQNNVNNAWTIGCYYNPVNGQYSSYVNGDLAEIWVSPLASATAPDLTPFGEFKPVTSLWGPKDLGNYCLIPNHGVIQPLLCNRGDANQFKYNLLPATNVIFSTIPGGTSPSTATDDPFAAIQ